MYLKRLEAIRYGDLVDTVVGGFGPGLNLGYGPNEAGKSTLTSLIRHVLYGFPRGRVAERLYLPPAGDHRCGRLVFMADGGETVVERTEGVHGGEVVVSTEHGRDASAEYLESITAGIGGDVYRTVFGFSLEELSDMGSLADIQSRLYATTAGLRVNPYDVVEELRQNAEALWAPRARTKELHLLGKELRKIREDRRAVEEGAERYRADRERRDEIAVDMEAVEKALQSARMEEERLAALLTEGRRFEEKIAENDEVASELGLEAERSQREGALIEVDDVLLSKTDDIERLGTRFELFRAEVEHLRRDFDRLHEVERDLQRRARDMGEGFTLDEASDVHFDLELENRLAEAEERLQKLRHVRDASTLRANEARNEHHEALRMAKERSLELGIGAADDARDTINLRMDTVDRLLAIGTEPPPNGPLLLPAVGATAIATVMVIAGLALEDRFLAWAAVLPALLAMVLFVRHWLHRRQIPVELSSLMAVLALDQPPTAAHLMEARSELESGRQLWSTERQLERKAAAHEITEKTAVEDYDCQWAEWLAWLDKHGLQTQSGQPESVRRVMRLLRDLRTRMEGRQELEAQIDRRRATCDRFVEDARKIGAAADSSEGIELYEEVEHSVRSILARLGAARRHGDQRRDLRAAEDTARERAGGAEKAAVTAREALKSVAQRADLGNEGSLAELEAALAVARRRAVEVEAERSELLEARGTLEGRLETGAEESASARLRLAESGLEERIAETVESFAAQALAARLLEQALGSYEAEKQPAVLQRAQEIFALLTEGRYTKLATPLGRFEPTVADGSGAGKEPGKLSRATAEQLFLALRLSYIENLSGAHPALPVIMDDVLVNFDDRRRQVAFKVIADFARNRQVIFFTCHSATVAAFKKAAPECTLIEMG